MDNAHIKEAAQVMLEYAENPSLQVREFDRLTNTFKVVKYPHWNWDACYYVIDYPPITLWAVCSRVNRKVLHIAESEQDAAAILLEYTCPMDYFIVRMEERYVDRNS